MIDPVGRIRRILIQTDKWPGVEVEAVASGLNLNAAGGGTSGPGGADVFTIPATGRIEILCAIIDMVNCTNTAGITIRGFTDINGVNRMIYQQPFTRTTPPVAGSDPDGIMVINGNFGANEPIRFEMYSDNGGDNNVDVPYKAIWRILE